MLKPLSNVLKWLELGGYFYCNFCKYYFRLQSYIYFKNYKIHCDISILIKKIRTIFMLGPIPCYEYILQGIYIPLLNHSIRKKEINPVYLIFGVCTRIRFKCARLEQCISFMCKAHTSYILILCVHQKLSYTCQDFVWNLNMDSDEVSFIQEILKCTTLRSSRV